MILYRYSIFLSSNASSCSSKLSPLPSVSVRIAPLTLFLPDLMTSSLNAGCHLCRPSKFFTSVHTFFGLALTSTDCCAMSPLSAFAAHGNNRTARHQARFLSTWISFTGWKKNAPTAQAEYKSGLSIVVIRRLNWPQRSFCSTSARARRRSRGRCVPSLRLRRLRARDRRTFPSTAYPVHRRCHEDAPSAHAACAAVHGPARSRWQARESSSARAGVHVEV